MSLVTLIGEKLAKESDEFIYIGPNNECRNCKLKTVCFNLKLGRQYKITKIREKRHRCSVHEGDVVIVEVQEMPITTTIDKKLSEGSTSKIEKGECANIECISYELCHNRALQKDKKYKIITVYESIDCPKRYDLQKAELAE